MKAAGLSGLTWLTPLGDLLAKSAGKKGQAAKAKSVIVLWMAGGPSQLETFDPHAGKPISDGTGAIKTSVKGIQLAKGMEQTAEVMGDISLIRSVVSREGDHERATYNVKTGYRPNPTVVHPSLGSIITHEIPNNDIEIPTHISILSNQWPPRGGYFGPEFDAFKVGDPNKPIPDLVSNVDKAREKLRYESLSVVERVFARGRQPNLDRDKTLHMATIKNARRMMTSDQLKAFDISGSPGTEVKDFGETPFGRGCLAAVRLVEAGVQCVEVNLNGWDTHVNNKEGHAKNVPQLDAGFAGTIKALKARGLLDSTLVLCGGEFGRTPKINPFGGRDHWPHGFSIAMAGGGIRGGHVIGSTDPNGQSKEPENPVNVQNIHATILQQVGLDPEDEIMTPVGRPILLSDGAVIEELLA